jgi:hypothetical protein
VPSTVFVRSRSVGRNERARYAVVGDLPHFTLTDGAATETPGIA